MLSAIKTRIAEFTLPTFKRPTMPWTKQINVLKDLVYILEGDIDDLKGQLNERINDLEDSMGSCAANMDDLETQVNDNCISCAMVEGMIEDAIEEIDIDDQVNMVLRHASFEVSLCI